MRKSIGFRIAGWVLGLLVLSGILILSAPSATAESSPTTAVACSKLGLETRYLGEGEFQARTRIPCTINVSTYTFDHGYTPHDYLDYGHPQTEYSYRTQELGYQWETFSVPVPLCGSSQSDIYVGSRVEHLDNGDLGEDAWADGGVDIREPCSVSQGDNENLADTGFPALDLLFIFGGVLIAGLSLAVGVYVIRRKDS